MPSVGPVRCHWWNRCGASFYLTAPSHYLNLCWLIETHFNQIQNIVFIQENVSGKIKMSAILFQPWPMSSQILRFGQLCWIIISYTPGHIFVQIGTSDMDCYKISGIWQRNFLEIQGPDSIQRCHLTSIGNLNQTILGRFSLHNGISYAGKRTLFAFT